MALTREAQALIAETNKQYGEGTVIPASEIVQPDRITTGSLAFDVSMGGGWPVNQWHELIGLESSGKTMVCLQTIAANQALDPEFVAVWIAAEWYDRDYAEMNGVDNNRVIVVNENITENAFGIALKWLKSQQCDFLVIDSLPAMTPSGEVEADMEEMQVALQARLTNKFFRKTGSSGKRAMTNTERPCTGILINQWRDKIGIQWGDPRTTPGGNGKNYACFTRTEIRRDDWIEVGSKGAKVRVGQTVKCRTFKNKSAPPHKVATFDFYFQDHDVHPAGTIDTFKEMVGLGVVFGVIDQSGSWFEYQGIKTQGAEKLVDALAADLEAAELLRKEVLEVATKKKPFEIPNEIDPEDGISPEPVITDPPRTSPAKRTVSRTKAGK